MDGETSGSTAPPVARRVLVSFAGQGAGRGELSWGQREIWSAMARQGWLNIGGVIALPPGSTIESVADELSFTMGRFPSMRTRLWFDENGRASQELFASGQIAIEVFDADDGGGAGHDEAGRSAPEELAALIEARYKAAPRDFVNEWPQRVAVIRRRGQLTHMVVVTCHLVTDAAGVDVMNSQMTAGRSAVSAGMQQLEQAVWQRSASGRRQSDASLGYWERMLRSIPPRPLPTSADPRSPRHWTGRLRSPALRAAVPLIAERTNTDSSSVLLTLYAVALGEATGFKPVVVWPLVNNRFRPGLGDVVCNLVQSGICVIDIDDGGFDDVARRTWRAAITAYKNAYYDSEKHDAMMKRIAPDYGPESGIAYFFNDRRSAVDRAEASEPTTPQQIREAGQSSTFSWILKKDNPFERLFLNIEDDPEVVELTIAADTYLFAPAQIEGLVRHMEALAITQATR